MLPRTFAEQYYTGLSEYKAKAICDTDSLAIVASRRGGKLRIPGSGGTRILSWADVQAIVDKFATLNPYDRNIVKGSILNLSDATICCVESLRTRCRTRLHP
jgi:hypothetical protein